MGKNLLFVLLFCGLLLSIKITMNVGDKSVKASLSTDYNYETNLKQDIFSLMMAYPEHIVDIEVVDNSIVYFSLKSGGKILYDNNQSDKMTNPDLKSMMEQRYILHSIDKLMPQEYNPGRIRVYPLLKEVYGANQYEIEKNLSGVKVGSNFHRFNDNNNGANHLKSAISELNTLAEKNPRLWAYIYPIGGAYNFRYIAKTSRLSPHAFGIAIDLASSKDDYWQWASRTAGEKRIRNYPKEIVDVMERNHFVWGGKWGQFDILHFEYRPEIIMKAMYFSNETKDVWFENLPASNMAVSELICLIEDRLQNFVVPN